jgi:hypothetical protein
LPFSRLIGFRFRNGDGETLRAETQIFHAQTHEFRTAKGPGETDQEKGPVARRAEIPRHRAQHPAQ